MSSISAFFRSHVPALVLVTFCIVACGAVAHEALSPGISPNAGHLDVSYWRGRIRVVGAPLAYAELARDLAGVDPSTQHGAAHVFGDALYAEKGLDGISICDTRFFYGCYHEFIGRAIVAQGLSVVGTLDRFCAGNIAGCQHGIGHGILAYLGYSQGDLSKALSACASLPDEDKLQGCDAGVYMEYNLETMLQGSSTTTQPVRLPDPGGMFAPCDKLALADQRICYQWQPQWWWVYFTEVQKIDPVSAFKNTAALCEKIGDLRSREACVEGAGLMAPPAAGYDPHGTAKLCDAAFTHTTEQLLCVAYAANVFETTESTEVALHVCDGLSGFSDSYCSSYAGGTANIAHPAPLPTI